MDLLAERDFPYAGGTIAKGERFTARSAFDALVLKRAGHAIDLAPAVEAGDVSTSPVVQAAETPKRRGRPRRSERLPDED